MMVAGKNSAQRALSRYMCMLHCYVRDPTARVNMCCSAQMFENINDRIDVMLPGASSDKFIFETTPFKAILGLGTMVINLNWDLVTTVEMAV